MPTKIRSAAAGLLQRIEHACAHLRQMIEVREPVPDPADYAGIMTVATGHDGKFATGQILKNGKVYFPDDWDAWRAARASGVGAADLTGTYHINRAAVE